MGESSSRFPFPALDTLPDDLQVRIKEVHDKAGFIPNIFLALAHRPDEFRAFMAYHDALMEKQGGLSLADREMIVVATSSANECLYCVIAHGALLRIRSKNPLLADQIATNYRKAEITEKQHAMLEFAMKVRDGGAAVSDVDFEHLHAHGFSDEDIWDIGSIVGLFALSNRLVNVVGIAPNDEFYMLGRG